MINNQDNVMTESLTNHLKVCKHLYAYEYRDLGASAVYLCNRIYLLTEYILFSICDTLAGGVRSMTGKAAA